MSKNYKIIENLKKNVDLVENLKGDKLVRKSYPKKNDFYSSIYLNEIKVLEKLQYKNIVKVEKSYEDDDNYYLLFKWIDGEKLKFENNKCKFFKTLIKILETLDYIHSHDFIHKDIKPSNIMIEYSGEPYILDFGTSSISNTLTQTRQELSLRYASPEQKNNLHLANTTDFYSLGITVIEAILKNDELLKQFDQNIITVEELISKITIFNDDRDEQLHNILKQLTFKDKIQRYQNAKEIIKDINLLLSFSNCYDTYELNIYDKVKGDLQEDFSKSPWEILEFVQDKLNREIKYIEYKQENQNDEKIVLATNDFIFNCNIKSESHFFVYGYSKRVPESIKQHGQIIDDKFILTNGYAQKQYTNTYTLINKLERKKREQNKQKDENQKKKSFLDKTNKQLKIERALLEEKNISFYAKQIQHHKASKELIVEKIDTSNIDIKEIHLRNNSPINNEKFLKKLFDDGFIDNPSQKDILEVLNNLVKEYFFEKYKQKIAKKLFETLSNDKKQNSSIKDIEELLQNKYEDKKSNLQKRQFNALRLFDMYPKYLIKEKEDSKIFSQNDDVVCEGLKKNNQFQKNFVVKEIIQTNNKKTQLVLEYFQEISIIPNELKISFNYDIKNAVLGKQENSIKDLKKGNTTIDNFLGKIANPNTLSPKREIPKLENYINKDLLDDENQQEAVDKALCLDTGEYLVIQGPPGTGKTTVITEIVKQILSKNKLAKILVTSQSNQAVDNVLEKICENEKKIVRFGKDLTKISNKAQEFHEERVFNTYLQDMKQKAQSDDTNYYLQSDCLYALHEEWKNQIFQGDDEFKSLLFKKIRVIFGTLVGISSWQNFKNVEFDYIIVDEAGRALLPELLIPLKNAKRFILVGDHKQLPPVIDDEIVKKHEEYTKEELKTTIFEELYEKIEQPDFRHFLKFNYRSHKCIAKIYSDIFYDKQIETKGSLEKEHGLDFDKKVYFYSTSKLDNRFDDKGRSKKNHKNKEIILSLLKEIEKQSKEKGIGKSIGVITPYIAQRDNIRSGFGKIKKYFKKIQVDINTIDAFQGSDRDIIIYDITRSVKNNKANIEFIADEQRLNVALSRTKELLFIVGDADFIHGTQTKNKKNPFKEIIEMIVKDKEYYEMKVIENG